MRNASAALILSHTGRFTLAYVLSCRKLSLATIRRRHSGPFRRTIGMFYLHNIILPGAGMGVDI